MIKTFNSGDTVYSIHGQAARYVARVSAGHIVEPIYEVDDEEPPNYFDEPQTWRDVFAKPPVAKLETEVAEQERRLASLQQQITERRTELMAFEKAERARQERIKQHEQLAALDDYLAGRITHFVVTSDYDAPNIVTYEQAIVTTDEDCGRKNLRLLGLFGDPKRNLRWKIMWYSDGSGSVKHEVFPCTSLEEAQTRLAAILKAGWDEVRNGGKYHHITRWVKAARNLRLEVPQDMADAADRIGREAAQKALQSRRDEVLRAQKNLEEVEREFADVLGVAP